MNEQKQKTITRVGMWITVFNGGFYGLIFIIAGYFINWNHGRILDESFWKVLLIGFHSIMMGVYIGKLIVRKRAQKRLAGQVKPLAISSRLFLIVLFGSIAAFIVSWEIGYIFGKILGVYQGLSWGEILIYIPLVSLIHSIPFSLVISIFYSVFVFAYLKVGKK